MVRDGSERYGKKTLTRTPYVKVTNELNVTLESLSDVIGSTCDVDPTVFIYLKDLELFVTIQNNKINFIKHSLTKETFNYMLQH